MKSSKAGFSTDYQRLVVDLTSVMYPKTKKTIKGTLNNVIDGKVFQRVFCGWLGYESGHLWFADPNIDRNDEKGMILFHEALDDGVVMPIYNVFRENNNTSTTFGWEVRSAAEINQIKKAQKRLFKEQLLTAQLAYKNLISGQPRRSKNEAEKDWILISEGEIVVFALEWQLRKCLIDKGILTKDSALYEIQTTNIVEETWSLMFNNRNSSDINKRGDESYLKALEWLRKVLANLKGDYDYLWESKDSDKNWFIRGRDELKTCLNGKKSKKQTIKEIAILIVKHTCYQNKQENVDLRTSGFFRRTRINPEFALIQGTRNTVIFFIEIAPMAELPVKALLIGIFQDEDTCKIYYDELKTLFQLLATRDIFRYSMLKLAQAQIKLKRTEDVMATLSGSLFIHELKNPISLMQLNAKVIEDRVNTRNYDKIEAPLQRIRKNADKANNLIEMTRNLARITLKEKQELNLTLFIPNIIEEIKKEIRISKSIEIHKSICENLTVFIDETSLKIVLKNILANAAEAMRGRGKINIYAREDDDIVYLEIQDSGPGIDKKLLPNIFEQFRTTKGEGSGLGLYICFNLLKLQDVKIRARNLKNGGASFIILFERLRILRG